MTTAASALKNGIWGYSATVLMSLYLIQRDAPAFLSKENLAALFSPVQAQVSIQGLQYSFSALTVLWPIFLASTTILDSLARSHASDIQRNGAVPTDSLLERLYLTKTAENFLIVAVLLAAAFHLVLFLVAAFLFTQGLEFAPQGYSLIIVTLQGATTMFLIAALVYRNWITGVILQGLGFRQSDASSNPG